MNSKLLTLNQLHKSGKIWWIKSLPTLKKWVLRDKDHNNFLKVQIVNEGNAPRYYFLPANVEKYVEAFNKGQRVNKEVETTKIRREENSPTKQSDAQVVQPDSDNVE